MNKEITKHLLVGFIIGIANIIPGVSGGTMALVLGIYERLLKAIAGVNLSAIKRILASLQRARTESLREVFRDLDFWFLGFILIGACLAIISTSKLITYLLAEFHDPTFAFFSGLILVSLLTPIKMIKNLKSHHGLILVIAVAITIGLSASMSGDEKLRTEKQKFAAKSEASAIDAKANEAKPEQPSRPFSHFVFYFVCGAVAISAMILPGISGSFVLLLLGVYFEILSAINHLDFPVIAAVALGCLLGLLIFTRLLELLLQKYHDGTIVFLIGLMLGSLYGLWPFKAFEYVGDKRVDLNHVIPAIDANFMISVLLFLAGGAVVYCFYLYEKSNAQAR